MTPLAEIKAKPAPERERIIREMPAGYECDLLVAEALGWEKIAAGYVLKFQGAAYYFLQTTPGRILSSAETAGCLDLNRDGLWEPSVDLSLAWPAAEAILLLSDDDGMLIRARPWVEPERRYCTEARWAWAASATGPTAALSACRALLLLTVTVERQNP
jgi:hypothetical protein